MASTPTYTDRTKILCPNKAVDSFTELINKDSLVKTHLAAKADSCKALAFRYQFIRDAQKLFSQADPCSIFFSSHAFIDCLNELTSKEDFHPTPEVYDLYHQLLVGSGFLFYEINDSFQLEGQLSFRDIYVNRFDFFRFPDKDISFAIDFALGLGIPGNPERYYHAAAAFCTGNLVSNKQLPPSFLEAAQGVKKVYDCAGKIASLDTVRFQAQLRNTLRQAVLINSSKRLKYNLTYQTQLFNKLRSEFSEQYLCLPFDDDYSFRGIHTLDDLLYRIAHVFTEILYSRSFFSARCKDPRCSREQLRLILPVKAQIISSVKDKSPDTDIDARRAHVLENQKIVFSVLYDFYAAFSMLSDPRNKTFFKSQTDKAFIISDWPSPAFEADPEQISIFKEIVFSYKAEKEPRYLPQISDDSAKQLLDFVTNENIFDITFSKEGENMEKVSLAPLIAWSILESPAHVFRSINNRKWKIEELLCKRPLSWPKKRPDRLRIGLYIRLRNFFATYYFKDNKDLSRVWDQIFCDLTNYSDAYMLFTDGQSSTFDQDIWATDALIREPVYPSILSGVALPNPVVPHTDVFRWMEQKEQSTGSQTLKQYFYRMIRKHPDWSVSYRKLCKNPTMTADLEVFLKDCIQHCEKVGEFVARVPEYPYEDCIPYSQRFRVKRYPLVVMDLCFQKTMYKESLDRMNEITQRMFPSS